MSHDEIASRRLILKLFSVGTTVGLTGGRFSSAASTLPAVELKPVSNWTNTHDRVWLGAAFWANPMEGWRVKNGAAECIQAGGNRNIHLITHQITSHSAPFAMAVKVKRVETTRQDGGAGFRIGIRSDVNDHRSNSFTHRGINAGLIKKELRLGPKAKTLPEAPGEFGLVLTGKPAAGQFELTLTATTMDGKELGSVTHSVPGQRVLGNVSIVNNFDTKIKRGARYRFAEWKAGGDAFTITPSQEFGPILWSMYSLSDSRGDDGFVMKISALTGPLGEKDNHAIELHIKKKGQWTKLATESLDTDAWTATFRIPRWDEKVETPYKLVYREQHPDDSTTVGEWSGKIKANPSGRPLRLGALTCQKDYGFPYAPVAENLVKLDPDMLYFSGDQLYENHGGYGLIRDPAPPAILNYLRKYYMFGWAFREAMKDRPTLVIPDDHDVFQGNIWGEGGAKMGGSRTTSSNGGYREPAQMVNVVHKTCAGHHPDFYDPKPCKQDISVYYGDMVYGGVSFAVLGDRQWKSAPTRVDTGGGRADHVSDKNFDCSKLDKPGLILLGERQEEFLQQWSKDWRGHSLKVLLSQTVFAGVATHHGGFNGFLKADLDSGGWPQTARNRAIQIIREAQCLHICGDQHLATISQYGVEAQRDGNWVFCTPAIAAGYPRWWRPDDVEMPHKNRPKHGIANTGEYVDGFGNKVYVYGVGNPEVGREKNRYKLAHQKGSGFGLVTIDPAAKTYQCEAFRFLVDATDGKTSNQFPGWPLLIHQAENRGKNQIS